MNRYVRKAYYGKVVRYTYVTREKDRERCSSKLLISIRLFAVAIVGNKRVIQTYEELSPTVPQTELGPVLYNSNFKGE